MYKKLKSPLSVQLELLPDCNNKCVHCYNHWREEKQQSTTFSFQDIAQIIGDLKRSEINNLTITGGEPFLNKKLLAFTLRETVNAGLKCSLNSNLTILDEDVVGILKEFNIPVLTSLLSFDEEKHDYLSCKTGAFKKTIKNIKYLIRSGVFVACNMVVMQQNIDDIYETGRFIKNIGVNHFFATKVHPSQFSRDFQSITVDETKLIRKVFDDLIRLKDQIGMRVDTLTVYPLCIFDEVEKYKDLLIKRNCGAGKTTCTIGFDGEIRPCGHIEWSYGNILQESIVKIWERFDKWRSGEYLPQKCLDCKYLAKCSGGCRADSKFCDKIGSLDPLASKKEIIELDIQDGKIKLIDQDQVLIVNPDVIFREEEFGFICLTNQHYSPLITKDTVQLLLSLKGRRFTINEIQKELEIDKKLISIIFSSLERQNVVFKD